MSSSRGVAGFIAGTIVGAALGAIAGVLIAPRAGAETRNMVNEAATDAWGNVVDAYEQGTARVNDQFSHVNQQINDFRPTVDAKSDELREKVDQARARMDQIRSSLSQSVNQMADRVNDAMDAVANAASVVSSATDYRGSVPAEQVEVTDPKAEAPKSWSDVADSHAASGDASPTGGAPEAEQDNADDSAARA